MPTSPYVMHSFPYNSDIIFNHCTEDLVTMFQPQWPPGSSWAVASEFQPQVLCTCLYYIWKCCLHISSRLFPHFHQDLLR
jgi:hypothetical protein